MSQDAEAAARALLGVPIQAMRQVGGGRNSRVFRVECEKGVFALKQYPAREDDTRDRLGTEAAALAWMERHGIEAVPRLVAADAQRNFSLLSWAEGALVTEVGAADIDQAADFLARLHALRGTTGLAPERLATEACLSGAEIERQIEARLSHLRALSGEPALQAFLGETLTPLAEALLARARARVTAAGLSFSGELEARRRSPVPSDFGFHNVLKADGGRLTFIDFEYFGWDDPVKLTSDVLLHPGTPVAEPLRQRFRTAALGIYGEDPVFETRLDAYHPLFGLRWALILLNEFHPERWRRRVLAGDGAGWEEAKSRQLLRSRDMLSRVTDWGER